MHEHHEIHLEYTFFLPQEANIQSKSKRNQSHTKIWQKLSFPNPYDENPNQEHKNSPKHNLRIKIKEKSLELP